MNNEHDFYDNCFDVLRYIAAFIVLLGHSLGGFELTKPVWILFFGRSQIGVATFFVLSGYLTFASYDRIRQRKGSVWEFVIKRIFRIIPIYLFSIVVQLIVSLCYGKGNNKLFYILTYPFKGDYTRIGHGVLWTLTVEITMYILTPLMYGFVRKLKPIQWGILLLLFFQLNVWDKPIALFVKSVGLPEFFSSPGVPYTFIYEFLIGWFYYCNRDILRKLSKKRIIVLSWILFSIWTYIYYDSGMISSFGVRHNPVNSLWVCAMIIPTGYAFGKIKIGIDLTYDIYVLQVIVISTVVKIWGKSIVLMFVAWAFILAISVFAHFFIEKPCSRLKKS